METQTSSGVEASVSQNHIKKFELRKTVSKYMKTQRLTGSFIYKIWFINIAYDLLSFGVTPSVDTMKGLIDTSGIMAALILSCTIGLPLALSSEEWEEIFKKFDDPSGLYYDCKISGQFLVEVFTHNSYLGVYCVFSSLLIIIILTAQYYMTEIQYSGELRKQWWIITKYLLLTSYILLVAGICRSVDAIFYFTVATQPNPHVIHHGCKRYDNVETGNLLPIYSTNISDTWGNAASIAGGLMIITPIFMATVWAGWTHYNAEIKYKALVNHVCIDQ